MISCHLLSRDVDTIVLPMDDVTLALSWKLWKISVISSNDTAGQQLC